MTHEIKNAKESTTPKKQFIVDNKILYDLPTAVEQALILIRGGYRSFFIDTKFGSIPIEAGNFNELSTVENWDTCKVTSFIINNRSLHHKHVVRIYYKNGQDEKFTRMELAWALTKMMLIDLLKIDDIDDIWVDTLLVSFDKHYGCYQNIHHLTDYDYFVEKYINIYNPLAKLNKNNYNMLVHMGVKNAKQWYGKAEKNLNEILTDVYAVRGVIHEHLDYGDEYHASVMAVILNYNETVNNAKWVSEFNHDQYNDAIFGELDYRTCHGYDVIKYILSVN